MVMNERAANISAARASGISGSGCQEFDLPGKKMFARSIQYSFVSSSVPECAVGLVL